MVLVDGEEWREVIDVWTELADFDPEGWTKEKAMQVTCYLGLEAPVYMVVDLLDEEACLSDGRIHSRPVAMRAVCLVEIQIPAGTTD